MYQLLHCLCRHQPTASLPPFLYPNLLPSLPPSLPLPGLVFPVFAKSKSAMVVAGVIPIDRLTDIRTPIELVAQRLGRWQLENCYSFK